MRVALGSDHAGFALKEALKAEVARLGHEVTDLGTTNGEDPVDYPDYGAAVGRAVTSGRADLGVCVCGTGIGISMAANKVAGVRAAVVHCVTTAALARRHNHANVACLGARVIGTAVAFDTLAAFLTTGEEHGRHDERIAKLTGLDRERELVHESEGAP